MPHADHARRYGLAHRRLRQQLLDNYQPGSTTCVLCGQVITTVRRRNIHLAHHGQSNAPAGLAHAACNLGDAAKIGNVSRVGKIDPPVKRRTQW